MFKRFTLSVGLLTLSIVAFAQNEDRGNFSAGLETNTTYYLKDEKTGAALPDGRMGSNNYLKLDYTWKGLYVGGQLEGYLPAINGYYPGYEYNFFRADVYAGYNANGWDVRLGSLYEQFGSGLLFRTYEDRTLGINNALRGVKVGYTFGDFLTVKAIYGQTRDVTQYIDGAMVSGADLSLSISRAAKWENFDWTVEGSVLDKYEAFEVGMGEGAKPHTLGYSARMALGYAGFRLSGEYMSRRANPELANAYDSTRTEAIQVDFGYTGHGFGALVSFRKLHNPFLQASRDINGLTTYINYVPALTQQHTYSLATLNPYTSQSDEIGGQADLYYNFRRGTALGGRKGMKIHANYSNYYGHPQDMMTGGWMDTYRLLYRDLTVDIERWFGSDFKMILFYSWQTYNHGVGDVNEFIRSHTVVADMTYKIDRKNSLRLELQHMYSKDDSKSWAAALLEYSFAPRWSVSVQDMWNYGDTKIHYVNGSVSYSYSRVRAALNFGRFKDGYQCSGGVCRYTPAYTGVNLSLVVSL
ncbi:MAG TPA: hypothetical protein IAC04_04100 [Candidatus Coprenecus stercoravium]|uniref:Alginate export domain-containing protein n=1 Tax=Candidatus Coprenecus stercoravium TaxID=2840735 RepID=A0A9D2K8P1_9BACT|nr:hypothetical protein [Candidatus Coprenecus stercoravium]